MKELFEGKAGMLGGLSNEEQLVKLCPAQFKQENKWSKYASELFFSGGNKKNWQWKTSDKEEQKKQFACFRGLLSTWGIKHEHKEAVAGWMLSEMLTDVPVS